MSNTNWWVYIVECCDSSLYTGSTNDLAKRIDAHNSGTGSKYTRAHLPVQLVYEEQCVDHSHALKREAAIKKMKRQEKVKLIANL